jgi:D-glycero-beta-D-manno-heptose-7-phosphate kinase
MKLDRKRFDNSSKNIDKIKVLVVGDIILDEYLFGEVNRISPEAPVPIVLVKNSNTTLGGAGNVVKNLSAFGVSAGLLGRVGQDEKGELCQKILTQEKIDKDDLFLIKSKELPTIIKTRILASHQQICRVDKEVIQNLSADEENSIKNWLDININRFQAVILSDYDKGFLSKELIKYTIDLAIKNKIFISADPQVSHFFTYNGISLMTPNHHEAGKALNKKLSTEKEIEEANIEITEKLNSPTMMITRGEKGMSVYIKETNKHHHIPTVAREVFDVTGAGDTVISIYTIFIACGLSELESAIAANSAAGIVVEKLGASTLKYEELYNSMEKLNIFI